MLKLANGSADDQSPPGLPPVHGRPTLSLRRLVLSIMSLGIGVWVWHRTNGDAVLASGAAVLAFAALDHWVDA